MTKIEKSDKIQIYKKNKMNDIKLEDDISNLYGVGKYYNDKLKTLNINTIKDLL